MRISILILCGMTAVTLRAQEPILTPAEPADSIHDLDIRPSLGVPAHTENDRTIYEPSARDHALYLEAARRSLGDGAAGTVSGLTVIQTNFTDPEFGNVAFLIWTEPEENAAVVITVLSGEDTIIMGEVDPVPPEQRDTGDVTNSVFIDQLPAGPLTFRVEEGGVPDDALEVDQLMLEEQPFADVEDLSCSEGATALNGTCTLVIEWNAVEPLPSFHLMVANDQSLGTTVTGLDELFAVPGQFPDLYSIINIGFLETADGIYRGGFMTTECELNCDDNPCAPPGGIQVCQFGFGDDAGANALRLQWTNLGDYESINLTIDGEQRGAFDGAAQLGAVSNVTVGQHTVGLQGVCNGVPTDVAETTVTVLAATPHATPIADGILCEWTADRGDGISSTAVSWEIQDPSVFADLFIVDVNGNGGYLGSIPGTTNAVSVSNTAPDDVIFIQFFARTQGGCYGSDQIACEPPGNLYIPGNCNGIGVAPQITSAIFGLNWLFADGDTPPCLAACDHDGDGGVAINDMISILNFLFVDGAPAPAGWVDGEPRCLSAPIAACATPNPNCPL